MAGVSIHAVDIVRQMTCRQGVLCMTLDTRSIIYSQERRLFFSVSISRNESCSVREVHYCVFFSADLLGPRYFLRCFSMWV